MLAHARETDSGIGRRAAWLAGLAGLYACGAWLAAALTASAGIRATARLAAHWPGAARYEPALIATFGTATLAVIAIPTVALLARFVTRRRMLWAAVIALPAALPWLWNAWLLHGAGLQFQTPTLLMLGFETAKTLLVPALLAPIVPRFLPAAPAP